MKTKKEKIEKALANKLSRISAYSLVLVTMTFLGLYAGMHLDKALGMTTLFITMGITPLLALTARFARHVWTDTKLARPQPRH